MPKKTIYLSEEDAVIWENARRLLRYHKNLGLGIYLTPFLEKFNERHPMPEIPNTK